MWQIFVAEVADKRGKLRLSGLKGGRGGETDPFTLHRERNGLFDDFSRGFGLAPFGQDRLLGGTGGWPKIEVSETDKEVKVTAELPGLEEKDIGVELANGVLVIKGEKGTETEDKDRLFSERYYGRFERRIPVDEVEENKVSVIQERRPDHYPAEVGQGAGESKADRHRPTVVNEIGTGLPFPLARPQRMRETS